MKNKPWEKGSALIVAMLAVVLVAAIGIALVMHTQTDRAMSRNWAASCKSLYAADTGIQKLRELLAYDYGYDRVGLSLDRAWANRWLIVPPGTVDVAGTPAPTTDAAGNGPGGEPVGLPNVTFFDLRDPDLDYSVVPDPDPDNDGLIDIETPWYVNDLIPGVTGTIENNVWRILFRNFRETPAAATVSDRRLNLLAVGVSQLYSTSRQSAQGFQIRAGRFLEQSLVGEPVSVWDNIAFVGDSTSFPELGNINVYGSIHIIGTDPTAVVLNLSGNARYHNYYRHPNVTFGQPDNPPLVGGAAPDDALLGKLAPIPRTVTGEPTLHSKVRIRLGELLVESSSRIGGPDNPSTGKETFDALFTNGPYGNPDKIFFDRVDDYDLPEDFLSRLVYPDPTDNNQPYTEPTIQISFPNYQAFLVGNPDNDVSTNDFGAAGLDLTSINETNSNNPNDRWEFGKENDCNPAGGTNCESYHLLSELIYGSGSETRGTAVNNDTFINGRSMNWLTRNTASGHNPSGNPVTGSEGTIVYFGFDRTDNNPAIGFQANGGLLTWVSGPATNADRLNLHRGHYFVVKLISYNVPLGGTTVHYRVVHGLIYLKKATLVSQKFANFLFHTGGTDVNWTTMFPLATGHTGMVPLMNQFLTVPPQSTNINADVDIDPFAYTTFSGGLYNAFTPPLATLIGSGLVMLPGPLYFNETDTGASDGKTIQYDGRVTFYVPSWADGAATRGIFVKTHMLPLVQFPCNDLIALMSHTDVSTEGLSQQRNALVIYAKEKMTFAKQTDFAGTMVANVLTPGTGSGNPNYLQVPALNSCMPDFLIAKEPITYLRRAGWVER